MTRSVNKVVLVDFAVVSRIFDANRLAFNGNTALTLDIHRVKQLLFHIAVRNRARKLKDAVRNGRFTVIDVGDDGKISDMIQICCHKYLLYSFTFCLNAYSIRKNSDLCKKFRDRANVLCYSIACCV